MRRRGFLALAALAAAGLPACSHTNGAAGSKKVIVLGAGLAGLAAGEALVQAGHDVTILEASARAGGRVRTLRNVFGDGQHAEAGALFVPSNHELTRDTLRRFGLSLQPATPLFEAGLTYVRGQRLATNWNPNINWPFELTAEEHALGRGGMWRKYVLEAVPAIGDVTAPGWPSDPKLAALDRMSAAEFVRSRGASPEALALLRVGYLDMSGDGMDSWSALQMLHQLALMRTMRQRYVVAGGTDLLPEAFAARLGARIRYASPVVRIEPGATATGVVVAHDGRHQTLTADYVVCTLPFPVLKQIDVFPKFSSEKMQVIEQLPYKSIVRIFLQFAKKPWTEENLYVLTTTDLPVKWIFEHTVNQPGRRGILEAQVYGAEARRLSARPERERIAFALEQLEAIFPGIRVQYERGTSVCWDDEPWARGAYAYFRPGQMLSFLPHIARPEGRIHFAGEHTSDWPGWMQGALESGVRAAREIAQLA